MLNVFKLIRWPNLLIIAATLFLFKFFLIHVFFKTSALNTIDFVLFTFAMLCIAAGGNIINDLHDIEIDKINKPQKRIIGKKVSEKKVNYLYVAFTALGVLIGFYLANKIGYPSLAILGILTSIGLYFYSTYFKKIMLAGNILVAFFTALSIITFGVFELTAISNSSNQFIIVFVFKILLVYAVFAFLVNFLREIVKDIEDVDGDHANGVNSLPIVIGKQRTARLVSIISLLPIGLIMYLVFNYLYTETALTAYAIFLLAAPLLYVAITAWSAKKKREYSLLSLVLKMVMVLGICSLIIIKFTIFKDL